MTPSAPALIGSRTLVAAQTNLASNWLVSDALTEIYTAMPNRKSIPPTIEVKRSARRARKDMRVC